MLLRLQATGGDRTALRMLARPGDAETAGDDLAQRVRLAQGRGGEPLRAGLRAEGLDDVRVHHDAEAGSLAGPLGARSGPPARSVTTSCSPRPPPRTPPAPRRWRSRPPG